MNQEIKKDAGKLRLDLVPPEVILALGEVYTFGLSKGYKEQSWRHVERKRYIAADMRHSIAAQMNPSGKDEESGLLHLKHKLWNAATLLMLEIDRQEEMTEEKAAVIADSIIGVSITGKCKEVEGGEIVFSKNCGNCKFNYLDKTCRHCKTCGDKERWLPINDTVRRADEDARNRAENAEVIRTKISRNFHLGEM